MPLTSICCGARRICALVNLRFSSLPITQEHIDGSPLCPVSVNTFLSCFHRDRANLVLGNFGHRIDCPDGQVVDVVRCPGKWKLPNRTPGATRSVMIGRATVSPRRDVSRTQPSPSKPIFAASSGLISTSVSGYISSNPLDRRASSPPCQ